MATLRQWRATGRAQTKDPGSTSGSPERVEARSEVGEATERRDDDHGDHSGAEIVGEEEPVTVVIKTSKQHKIKHYSIETKP